LESGGGAALQNDFVNFENIFDQRTSSCDRGIVDRFQDEPAHLRNRALLYDANAQRLQFLLKGMPARLALLSLVTHRLSVSSDPRIAEREVMDTLNRRFSLHHRTGKKMYVGMFLLHSINPERMA
jgi:hypothetical protein